MAASLFPFSSCMLEGGGGELHGTPRGTFEGGGATGEVRRYKVTPKVRGGGKEGDDDDREAAQRAAVVLFYDAVGFGVPNPRLVADSYADQTGLDVFVPDYLPNPIPVSVLKPVTETYPGEFKDVPFFTRLWQIVRAVVGALPYALGLMDGRAMKLVDQALEDIKKDGYERIGAVGYCRGGAVVMNLLSRGTASPIECGVPVHPRLHEEKLWESITKPSFFQLASDDPFAKKDKILRLEAAARIKQEKGIDMRVHEHPETAHGFGVRPNLKHEPTKAAFESANAEAAQFLQENLMPGAK